MKLTKEKFIEEYYKLTYDQLSKKYKISHATIAKYAKLYGLSKERGRKRIIEEAKDAYK